MAGKAIPVVDRHKAPVNDMNRSNFGIAAAMMTVEKSKKKTFKPIRTHKTSNYTRNWLTCKQCDTGARAVFDRHQSARFLELLLKAVYPNDFVNDVTR